MMKGLSQLMKQAQEIQKNLKKSQEELESLRVTGESGGGMIKLDMTGGYDAHQISIDPQLLNTDDQEMLEDLIVAAINDATRKIAAQSTDKIVDMADGIGLPPGFKLPF